MGISYAPSPADELAPYIQKFGESLKNYLQPNEKFQKHMQEQLGENPELVLKFADLEAKAPGTLARLGFGRLGDTISQVPETAAGEVTRTMKPQQVAAAGADIAAKTSEAQLTTEQNAAVMDAMRKNPELTYQAAVATLKAPATKEQLAQQAVQQNQFEIDLSQKRKDLIKTLPDGKTIDFWNEAKEFANGRMAGDRAMALYADPQSRAAFEDAQRAYNEFRAREERANVLKTSKTDTMSDRVEARQAQNAYIEWSKSKEAGTIQAWQDYMYNPDMQKRGDDLLSGKVKPAGFADENLLEVARARQLSGEARFNSQMLAINNQVGMIISKIDKGLPDGERDATINMLNQNLDKRAALGGPKLKAKWRDVPWYRGADRLEFTDEKGREIPQTQVESALAEATTEAPPLSSSAKVALTRISAMGDSAAMQSALALMRAQDQSPNKEDSKAVEAEIRRMGGLK